MLVMVNQSFLLKNARDFVHTEISLIASLALPIRPVEILHYRSDVGWIKRRNSTSISSLKNLNDIKHVKNKRNKRQLNQACLMCALPSKLVYLTT